MEHFLATIAPLLACSGDDSKREAGFENDRPQEASIPETQQDESDLDEDTIQLVRGSI